MLSSLALNFNRRNEEAALYEMARVYLPETVPMNKLPKELNVLTMGIYGGKDFYDIKGAAEYVIKKLGICLTDVVFSKEPPEQVPHDFSLPFLHPARKACISINNVAAGFMGEVHPLVAEQYEINVKAYICVLYLDELILFSTTPVYNPLPRFPAMKRDIAPRYFTCYK
jgi:phenylalanyl-tRNA synthetase beta chain